MASFAGYFAPVSQVVSAKDAFSKEIKNPTREGNSNTLQYSCLENPMDRGA